MFNIALKSTWAHKRRLIGTSLAVVLGIAFLSGTLVLSGAVRQGFEQLFTEVNAGTDAVVRGSGSIASDAFSQQSMLDGSMDEAMLAVDGVAAAAPYLEGIGQIVGSDGVALGGDGPPTLAVSWIDHPDLNPYRIVSGREPTGPGEVVIDRATAVDGNLGVGDTTVVRMPQPVEARIVGLIEPASGDDFGGTTYAVFTLDEAQRHLTGGVDMLSQVIVAADPAVTQNQLVQRLQPLLPQGAEAISGADLNDELTEQLGADFLNFFEAFLLGFAAIALLVAGLSIYNTFSITVAQRSRESALLRTIGSSRGQVLASVVVETALLGVVASAVGLLAGVGLAVGLSVLLEAAFGFGVPTAAMSVDGTIAAVCFGVGLVVTMVAGAVPAVRASRVPPLAALREVTVDRSHASLVRGIIGVLLTVAGVALVVGAAVGSGSVLIRAGIGAALTMVGVVVVGPLVAGPMGKLLVAPLRLRGITGHLAGENAVRNPRRTAGAASALMIGVAVVTLFTVAAASIKTTIDETLTSSLGGDLVVTAGSFSGSGLPPELASDITQLPEVEQAVGIGLGAARIGGEETVFTVADPEPLGDLMNIELVTGSWAEVADDGIAITDDLAIAGGLDLGSTIALEFVGGSSAELVVDAIYAPAIGEIIGSYILPRQVWSEHTVRQVDTTVLIRLAEGVDLGDGRAAVEDVTATHGSPPVQDRGQYAQAVAGDIDQVLALVYVLLALAVVIALMGIANTMSLSVHERTRELGLLRAVGSTRSQIRSMVRGEAVIVSVFGTIGGLALGTFLGWGLMAAIAAQEGIGLFAVPFTQLAVVLALGAVVDIVAAVQPARRAARLDVLTAIATE
ncbi:MAG: FtsX-like permease family protein [Actinomycetota bacterium]|nr:FtsX-like permease family protein [Actinomycetota bacterium]